MGETELKQDLKASIDILKEQLAKFKINPKIMSMEELRDALARRYDIQLQIVLYTRSLMQHEGKKEKEVLKSEISLLKGFSKSVANEGRLYNRLNSRNPIFYEQEIMSEEEAREMSDKRKVFEYCSQLLNDEAKEKLIKLLKTYKVTQFLNNQRSIVVSTMVVSNLRKAIKNNEVDEPVEQISKITLEEESIVDTAAKNIAIVGLSDRVVDIYKLLRYKQLANRYRRETHSINRNNILRTSSDNSDLLIEAYSKAQHKFIESKKKTKLKLKGKGNK